MSRTLQPEDQISHYRVVGPLGAGGMGEVYIAQDEKLERRVALKVLPMELVRNEERVRRFITEAKSASSLNHPNIVTIYEIGHDKVRSSQTSGEVDALAEAVHFISMELISGDTLSQKIHHEKTDLRTLLGYMVQAAEGIAKAHAAGIVHRDLKPGNIMVSADGFVKVLDFGLAKLSEKQSSAGEDLTNAPTEQQTATGAGTVLGTVGYMSPEQVMGKTVDHRADIFSMGCILYEAATRKRPFEADTNVETMHQILKEKPRPIEDLNPQAPAEVRRIIRRCLAKSPDQRFQSMKDLAIDLREMVEDYDSLSPSATSASAASTGAGALAVPQRPGRGMMIVLALVAVLGIGGIGFGVYTLMGRAGTAGGAGTNFQDMKISVLMSRNDLHEAVLSADGRYLAYVTGSAQTTSLGVHQVRTGSDVVILPGQQVGIESISFSPDGDYLYYRNRDPNLPNYASLFQVPSLGGTPRKIAFDVDSSATFSPDGGRVCFRRGLMERGDSLVVTDLESGRERELLRIKVPQVFTTSPAWSPDGKRILVAIQDTTGGIAARLAVIDVESGNKTVIGEQSWIFVNSAGWTPDGGAVLLSGSQGLSELTPQIFRVSYPGGATIRLTNDLDGYTNISVSAGGSSVAAIRRSTVGNIWKASAEKGTPPEAITTATSSAVSVQLAVPLPGGAIAYAPVRDNKRFIWRMASDGSGQRQLTSNGVQVVDATWAPGAGIIFALAEAGEKPTVHIWRIDPDGSGLKQLTDGTGERAAEVSPAGNAILFRRLDDPTTLWVLRLDGTPAYKPIEGESGDDAYFSPDGKRILVTKIEGAEGRRFPNRYVIPLEGGAPLAHFLLAAGAIDVKWEPDGKALTYIDRSKGWNLMRKVLPDGEPTPLTHYTDGQIVGHDWHPDGSRLLFHRRVGQSQSIWVLKPGQGEPVMITEFKTGAISGHGWAPDEPLLYFQYETTTQDVVMISGLK